MFLEPDDLDGHGYFSVCLFLDSVAERFIVHRCWFEANVGPEAVLGTDERTSGCGLH